MNDALLLSLLGEWGGLEGQLAQLPALFLLAAPSVRGWADRLVARLMDGQRLGDQIKVRGGWGMGGGLGGGGEGEGGRGAEGRWRRGGGVSASRLRPSVRMGGRLRAGGRRGVHGSALPWGGWLVLPTHSTALPAGCH